MEVLLINLPDEVQEEGITYFSLFPLLSRFPSPPSPLNLLHHHHQQHLTKSGFPGEGSRRSSRCTIPHLSLLCLAVCVSESGIACSFMLSVPCFKLNLSSLPLPLLLRLAVNYASAREKVIPLHL